MTLLWEMEALVRRRTAMHFEDIADPRLLCAFIDRKYASIEPSFTGGMCLTVPYRATCCLLSGFYGHPEPALLGVRYQVHIRHI